VNAPAPRKIPKRAKRKSKGFLIDTFTFIHYPTALIFTLSAVQSKLKERNALEKEIKDLGRRDVGPGTWRFL
jgi:hypothetical protein